MESDSFREIRIRDFPEMDPYRRAFLGALVNTINFWYPRSIWVSHVFEEFECRANLLSAEDMRIPFSEAMNWLLQEGHITLQTTRLDGLITVRPSLITFVRDGMG